MNIHLDTGSVQHHRVRMRSGNTNKYRVLLMSFYKHLSVVDKIKPRAPWWAFRLGYPYNFLFKFFSDQLTLSCRIITKFKWRSALIDDIDLGWKIPKLQAHTTCNFPVGPDIFRSILNFLSSSDLVQMNS